jgi:hypothetical protein
MSLVKMARTDKNEPMLEVSVIDPSVTLTLS